MDVSRGRGSRPEGTDLRRRHDTPSTYLRTPPGTEKWLRFFGRRRRIRPAAAPRATGRPKQCGYDRCGIASRPSVKVRVAGSPARAIAAVGRMLPVDRRQFTIGRRARFGGARLCLNRAPRRRYGYLFLGVLATRPPRVHRFLSRQTHRQCRSPPWSWCRLARRGGPAGVLSY
jgi:hypothetical protein